MTRSPMVEEILVVMEKHLKPSLAELASFCRETPESRAGRGFQGPGRGYDGS